MIKPQQTPLTQRLTEYALLLTHHLLAGLLFTGETIAGHTAQATMFVSHVECCDHTAQITGEKTQDIVAQHR
ncbi:hypothetical protein D3C79_666220 [compost metagenome]